MNRNLVSKVWISDSAVWIELKDGRRAKERFADYSRLFNATDDQKNNYVLSHFGIHWPEIDEDLSYDGFFNKGGDSIKSTEN